MLVIIGAFCTQDVPGGHACSAHSLMRCCSVCCEQSQARRKLPALRPSIYRHQSCGSSFSSSTQRHRGLKFTLSCSFLPAFCIKVGQYFFSSFPLSAGPGCLGTCAKTSQLGEYRRGGQRYALPPPPLHFMHAKSLSCPTMPFVHWTHSCTNTNTQGHKQKSTFSKAHTSITGSLTLFA